jgi:RNA polymerase sigma-70 factor (ECF subfamily)
MGYEMSISMAREATVADLVRRARDGDRTAFDALAARFREQLLGSIRSHLGASGRGAEAEDVLGETMLRALAGIGRFEPDDETSFLRWLFGIARNVERELGRRRSSPLSLEAAAAVRSKEPSPSQAARRDERFERLERAIAALPPDYRDVVRLSRLEGLKMKDVAQRLGKSHDSVKHLLARALVLLREHIGDTQSLHLPDRRLDLGEGEVRE